MHTQNSCKFSKWLRFSMIVIRFLATSIVSISLLFSNPSIFSIPFSDMYKSVKLTNLSRFSNLTIRLACNDTNSKFVNLSKFAIFLILFLPKYKCVKLVKLSKFSITFTNQLKIKLSAFFLTTLKVK